MKGSVTRGKCSPFVAFQGARPCQDGRVGSWGQKSFLSRSGWKSLDGCGVNQANRFTATFGFSQADAENTIVNDTGIHCVAQLFFLMDTDINQVISANCISGGQILEATQRNHE